MSGSQTRTVFLTLLVTQLVTSGCFLNLMRGDFNLPPARNTPDFRNLNCTDYLLATSNVSRFDSLFLAENNSYFTKMRERYRFGERFFAIASAETTRWF